MAKSSDLKLSSVYRSASISVSFRWYVLIIWFIDFEYGEVICAIDLIELVFELSVECRLGGSVDFSVDACITIHCSWVSFVAYARVTIYRSYVWFGSNAWVAIVCLLPIEYQLRVEPLLVICIIYDFGEIVWKKMQCDLALLTSVLLLLVDLDRSLELNTVCKKCAADG